MRILVVPDAHARQGVAQRRFDWLGKLIEESRPDVVVDLGDWADMPSLCSYDKGKKCFEGRRYKRDIEAALEARDRVDREVRKLRKKPRRISLIGNHEARISRVSEENAQLEDVVSLEDVAAPGWEQIPFLQHVEVGGFLFQHYFTSGLMGRPIGGNNHAHGLLASQHGSCIQGHSHLFHYAERTRGDGHKIQAFVAGCFLDEDQWEDYAGPANKLYFKGLLLLEDVADGWAGSFKRVDMKTLEKNYDK